MEALRNTNDRVPMMRKITAAVDTEIPSYLLQRLKLRLGIVKPKQYRPTVHFEGLSRSSSIYSLSTNDSFQTFFNPGRISQCSDVSGLSVASSDSGIGTPSDHTISVYDYLTLDDPNDDRRPMDSIHLEHLYGRLESYAVDMMLRKIERVSKLSDEVLAVESNLLEITEASTRRRKALRAGNAAGNESGEGSAKTKQRREDTARKQSGKKNKSGEKSDPASSSSSVLGRLHAATISSAAKTKIQEKNSRRNSTRSAVVRRNDENETNSPRRRPYSDEGARNLLPNLLPETKKSSKKDTAAAASSNAAAAAAAKKTAW